MFRYVTVNYMTFRFGLWFLVLVELCNYFFLISENMVEQLFTNGKCTHFSVLNPQNDTTRPEFVSGDPNQPDLRGRHHPWPLLFLWAFEPSGTRRSTASRRGGVRGEPAQLRNDGLSRVYEVACCAGRNIKGVRFIRFSSFFLFRFPYQQLFVTVSNIKGFNCSETKREWTWVGLNY